MQNLDAEPCPLELYANERLTLGRDRCFKWLVQVAPANTRNTDLTDELCEASLRVLMRNAPIVYADPSNYEAWCELGFAGYVVTHRYWELEVNLYCVSATQPRSYCQR